MPVVYVNVKLNQFKNRLRRIKNVLQYIHSCAEPIITEKKYRYMQHFIVSTDKPLTFPLQLIFELCNYQYDNKQNVKLYWAYIVGLNFSALP